MEVTTLGNNTVTVCKHCDTLIAVKGDHDSDVLHQAVKAHRTEHPECRAYYDSLPSIDELLAKLHDHECITGPCQCSCGCQQETGCQNLFGPYCSTCHVRIMREDEEHGPKESAP